MVAVIIYIMKTLLCVYIVTTIPYPLYINDADLFHKYLLYTYLYVYIYKTFIQTNQAMYFIYIYISNIIICMYI